MMTEKLRSLHVVLFEPRIPQNAGNIARTCAAIGAELHLIRPLGFILDDRKLRRAGMDYWDDVQVHLHSHWDDFRSEVLEEKCRFLTKHAESTYNRIVPAEELYLVFGKETEGLPPDLRQRNRNRCYRIPMRNDIRSINLASAVAVVAYDLLRRAGYPGLR